MALHRAVNLTLHGAVLMDSAVYGSPVIVVVTAVPPIPALGAVSRPRITLVPSLRAVPGSIPGSAISLIAVGLRRNSIGCAVHCARAPVGVGLRHAACV